MKISEVKNNAFYQMPQWLYEPPYNVLSDKAKQVYSFFLTDEHCRFKINGLMKREMCLSILLMSNLWKA